MIHRLVTAQGTNMRRSGPQETASPRPSAVGSHLCLLTSPLEFGILPAVFGARGAILFRLYVLGSPRANVDSLVASITGLFTPLTSYESIRSTKANLFYAVLVTVRFFSINRRNVINVYDGPSP